MAAAPTRLVEQLDRAQTLADLQDVIVQLRDHFGVAHMVYHWVSADGEQFGCGTYAPAWVQHYVERDYLRVDPVVSGCYQRFHPVDWRALDWSGKAVQTLRSEALDAGVGPQGYSIPIRGPAGQFALFTVTDDRHDDAWDSFTGTHRRDLILLAHGFNQKALEIGRDRTPTPAKRLSGREVDALTFLAMGYSRGQIAEMLAISEHTLRAYVESARLKLGASNTTHAVARAVAEGHVVVGGAARQASGDWPGRDTAAAAE